MALACTELSQELGDQNHLSEFYEYFLNDLHSSLEFYFKFNPEKMPFVTRGPRDDGICDLTVCY